MEDFHKYGKIKQLGNVDNKDIFLCPDDEIVIQEKIDGANFRFIVRNGKVIFGSRTQQLTSDEGEDTNVAKNFTRCVEYVRKRVEAQQPEYLKAIEQFIFYGEACHSHSLSYDWDKIPPFLGFDMYDLQDKVYLHYTVAGNIFYEMGLNFVPIVKVCKAGDIKEWSDKDVPVSKYAPKAHPTQQAEGVVFKNVSAQIYAKYVREKFKELASETFGGTPKYEETDTGKFAARYCVNARIDKIIFKLVDDGEALDMPMMKYLPKAVYTDIMEEHGQEILDSKMTINFGQLRKIITKRCLSVLKQIITNNGLK